MIGFRRELEGSNGSLAEASLLPDKPPRPREETLEEVVEQFAGQVAQDDFDVPAFLRRKKS